MAKRKQDQLGGHDPWEWEVAYYRDKRGMDPDKARIFVIIRWAYEGDLRPLRAAIVNSRTLHDAVGGFLCSMIDEGRLIMKPPRRGRPRGPDQTAFIIAAGLLYENHTTDKSEDAFTDIAELLGKSHQSIRQAVTRWRKTTLNN
jgi:hypothetical protein